LSVLAILIVGALLGWFASIIERDEEPAAIRLQLLIGAITALIGAASYGGGSGMFSALDFATLGFAAASAAIVLTIYWFVFVRRT